MKREFAFEDSLQVLETLWASLPPTHADRDGLKLYEVIPLNVILGSDLDEIMIVFSGQIRGSLQPERNGKGKE